MTEQPGAAFPTLFIDFQLFEIIRENESDMTSGEINYRFRQV
jgi:hypothetical protein